MLFKQGIVYHKSIYFRISLKQTTIIGKNIIFTAFAFSAFVYIRKILFKYFIQRFFCIQLYQFFVAFHHPANRVRWQQSTILCKKDKQKPIKQFLCLLKHQQLIFLRTIGTDILPQLRLKTHIILI